MPYQNLINSGRNSSDQQSLIPNESRQQEMDDPHQHPSRGKPRKLWVPLSPKRLLYRLEADFEELDVYIRLVTYRRIYRGI
jgi:hypothetical protein